MFQSISLRLETERLVALAELVASEQVDRSEIIRRAIMAAVAECRRKRLLRESAALADDADDRVEIGAVVADMERLRA